MKRPEALSRCRASEILGRAIPSGPARHVNSFYAPVGKTVLRCLLCR